MNLLADESVDRQTVERLRQEGHHVVYVAEIEPSVSDEVVLSRGNEQGAVLLTGDKDFGELVFRENLLHAGVVLLRVHGLSAETKADVVATAIREHESELTQAFCVISHTKVRIRPKIQLLGDDSE